VEPGDVIYLPPFGDHELLNTAPAEDLHFLTVWWEDAATIAGLREGAPSAAAARPRAILTVATSGAAAAAAAIHGRYAAARGSRVRPLTEPPPAALSASAALALCARLQAAGEVVVESAPALHCAACGAHRTAAEVSGECPACGERATGDGCAACGQPAAGGEAWHGTACARCGGELERRPVTRLCFRLDRHREAIERQRGRAAMSPALRTLVDAELAAGLAPVAVSGPAGAGAGPEAPIPGLAGQRFEPWFVRAAWLLAATAEGARPEEQQVIFLQPGDARLHAVLLPALAAAGSAAAAAHAPAALIECRDQGCTVPGADGAIPAEGRAWLRRLARKLAAEHGGATPPTQAWTAEQQRFTGQLLRAVEAAGAAYEAPTFAPAAAARAIRDLFVAASEFAERDRPWSRLASRREERNTGVALELLALKALAMIAQPLQPEWSARLLQTLGYAVAPPAAAPGAAGGCMEWGMEWEDTPSLVPTGQAVSGLEELALHQS
jgi:methionyl-tRNA synthetase